MALPTPEKEWNFDVNITLPSLGTARADGQRLTRLIKTKILMGAKWTVKRSSNAVSAADSDLWTSDASIITNYPGSAHSWIVLRRIDLAFELLIDCGSTNGTNTFAGRVLVSKVGFSGGTITNRPTATDEQHVVGTEANSDPFGLGLSDTTFSVAMHNFVSNDGTVQRIVVLRANAVVLFIDLSTVKTPPSSWLTPFVVGWIAKAPTFANINNDGAGVGHYFGFHGSGPISPLRAYLGTESYRVNVGGTAYPIGSRQTIQNELSNAWSLTPAVVVGYSPGTKGMHGFLYDLWFGMVNNTNCTTYPADASRQFVQFADIVLPWGPPVAGSGPAILTG